MSTSSDKSYYRASLGLKKEIASTVAEDYHSALIEALRTAGGRLDLPGLTFHLATDFGFCYGVDKAIDMAYEARSKFPKKRIFLLTEIIHNPRVNRRLLDMGIVFLSGQYAGDATIDDIAPEDVVLIPAFGVDRPTFDRLRELGAILVDTTCGSVVHVWKRVERYARDGFTSLVHGKHYHEETLATVSQAMADGGHFLVVRDKPQTQLVCDFIEGQISVADLMSHFPEGAMSEGFDPKRDLRRIGVANQTTMLASESLEIAAMVGNALARRFGEDHREEHFRSFDTICSATQDRQDAIEKLVAKPDLDLVVVIGGYNSSNTGHLLAVAGRQHPAYHIQDSTEILSTQEIRHQIPAGKDKELKVTEGWLPDGPVQIGLTSGASTPNKAVADTIARIAKLRGLSEEQVLAAVEPA